MKLDDKTKSNLQKLQFTPTHIDQLENDVDLLSKTLGLLELIKRSPGRKETKLFVRGELKKIKQSLNRSSFVTNSFFTEARSEHYSFQKPSKELKKEA